MKKTIALFLAALCLTFVAATASAKPPKEVRAKFYDMTGSVIDGEIKKPSATWMTAREKVQWERLLKLKKSFMPAIHETGPEIMKI